MRKLNIIYLGLFLSFVFSCQKQIDLSETDNSNITKKLSVRSIEDEEYCQVGIATTAQNSALSPGAFVIENGMMKFASNEDFLETIDFLREGISSEIYLWKENLGITTAESDYLDFLRASCELEQGILGFDQLLTEYETKLSVLEGDEGELEFRSFYRTFPYFRNMDGLSGWSTYRRRV